MSEIDRSCPGPCHFCSARKDREVKALILPWPNKNMGYWHCKACTEKAEKQAASILEKHRILSFKVLPHWFLEWGSFAVRRSDGSTSEFELMNWKAEDKDVGRQLYLTKTDVPDILIDMALAETHSRFKKVSLLSLYRENSSMWNQPKMELRFPSFIGDRMAGQWMQAVDTAYDVGQKLMEDNVMDPTCATDDENDDGPDGPPPGRAEGDAHMKEMRETSLVKAAAEKKEAVEAPPPSPTPTEPLHPPPPAPKPRTPPQRPDDDFW